MIYGKVTCRIPAAETSGGTQHEAIMLTVAHTTTIKQGTDLVRLTWGQARELSADLAAALTELEQAPR